MTECVARGLCIYTGPDVGPTGKAHLEMLYILLKGAYLSADLFYLDREVPLYGITAINLSIKLILEI